MHIKKLLIVPVALALVISSVGCTKGTSVSYSKVKADKSADDEYWYEAKQDEQLTLQNSKIKLDFSQTTTHFTVTDLASGKQYPSYFNDPEFSSLSAEEISRMNSEVTITYYEEKTSGSYMYSTDDSVNNGSYRVTHSNDAIRVYYSFGATAESSFVPRVFEKAKYEKLLKEIKKANGEDGAPIVRRLGRFYTEYDKKSATKEIKQNYPLVKKKALFIVNEECTESDFMEIREYMASVNYGMEEYAKDLSALGVKDDAAVEQPGFTVPVEYKLTDDGFTVTVLSDLITENNDTYRLQSVALLEYFGAAKENDGKFFIPDGCGTVVNWADEHPSTYEGTFYGKDYSVFVKDQQKLANDLVLPVFGITRPDSGVFAIVERAAEIGTLHAKNYDSSTTPNHIYVDFEVRHMDTTDIGKTMLIPVFNIFANDKVKVSPSIRYVLLSAGNNEYDSMAAYYRDYLIKSKKLSGKTKDSTLIYLDYLGLITQDASFLGVPYKKSITLSTVSGINDSLEKLENKGVKNITLRLFGYTGAGLENKAENKFSLSDKVGSVSGLAELEKSLNSAGGKLYLDADFTFVYNGGNGFSKKTDCAHYLNRVLVNRGYYNRVTRSFEKGSLFRYFVSPRKYIEYAGGFIASAKKNSGLGKINVSYPSAGKYLGGDYTPKGNIDRPTALNYIEQTAKYAAKNADKVSFDSGNAYVLPYADDLFNVPLNSSGFDLESEYVPFYQMVVHGSINYAGQSINLSYDSNQYLLRSVEMGAIPYYTLINNKDSSFTNTAYETVYYSTSDKTQLDNVIDTYKRIEPYYKAIAGKRMTGHKKIADKIYCTTYENGSRVYVNYGDTDAETEGIRVKAEDFTFVG